MRELGLYMYRPGVLLAAILLCTEHMLRAGGRDWDYVR
jgi:hypothetical protein